ncbi:MAG: hypothetical protein ICV60_03350 [Pyrinomonadaceae bacterium]|nr:hypothetical protein [Pyrinomonadaceae bacterium]
MFDWQTILVTLFILAAALYVARRVFSRLRSFRTSKRNTSSTCDAGCGCGGESTQAAKHKTLTGIGRVRSS